MFNGFLNYFNKTVSYDIYGSDYRTFIIAFGGMQFGDGLFSVFDKGDTRHWGKIVAAVFSDYDGKFEVFGFDWLGRCFAVSKNHEAGESILIFDPSTLQINEIKLDLRDFVNKAIAISSNECLASNAFAQWRSKTGDVLEEGQCLGNKTPIFMGGADEGENFVKISAEEYWRKIAFALEPSVDNEETFKEKVDSEKQLAMEFSEEDEYYMQEADEAVDFFELQQKRTLYVQKSVERYLEKFKKMYNNDTNISWNWCAFLFSGPWLLYRKLYKCFIVTYLLTVVIGVVIAVGTIFGLSAAGLDPVKGEVLIYIVSIAAGLIIKAVLGIFSDSWYVKKIDRLVEAGNEAASEEEFEKTIKKGGVNIPLMVVFLLLCVAASSAQFFVS